MSSIVNTFLKSRLFEYLFVGLLLFVSAFAHGYNMLHFPYYENDEGVYMSQAWSLVTRGELAPYTYWYDHAPFGWMMIGAWTTLTGGFFTFGFAINSGRVFMLVLHVMSSFWMYLIMRKLSPSRTAAACAILLFSLSPLAIYFQRRVLLDNLMIFWVLLSCVFLLYYNNRLSYISFSAISLALGVLAKENAVFFVPIFFYWAWLIADSRHKSFAITQWVLIFGSIVSLYFYYALVKGEFFPVGHPLGKAGDHVSLLETLRFQSSRGGGNIADVQNSLVWKYVREWLTEDWIIILLGALATVFNVLLGFRNAGARLLGWMSALMWLFLMRGGIVIEFYVIPVIPLVSLNIAYMVDVLRNLFAYLIKSYYDAAAPRIFALVLTVLIVGTSFSGYNTVRSSLNIFTSDQTTPQKQAVEWIKKYRSSDDFIVIDNYAYLDLRAREGVIYENADWYWKIDTDKDVLQIKLQNDPSNIDYLAVTPQMEQDIAFSGLNVVGQALGNARPLTLFWKDGWGVTMWGTNYPRRILKASWGSYKRHFIFDGKVVDPSGNITTSEGQAYALLRAVMMNDRAAFTNVYDWSRKNLLTTKGLYAWKWGGLGRKEQIIDAGNATDADEDIALSLILACKKWNIDNYCNDARNLLENMWTFNVSSFEGKPYLLAGDWGDQDEELVLNPSYFAPGHYRVFGQFDTRYDWNGLVETSYAALHGCTRMNNGRLPPEWCALKKATGEYGAPTRDVTDDFYGFNAVRTPLRVAWDYAWFESVEARDYLSSLSFFDDEWTQTGTIKATYSHQGEVVDNYESAASYAGAYSYFFVTNPQVADEIYTTKLFDKFYENSEYSYWDDTNNYYTQNLAWFATALHGGVLRETKKDLQF